MYRLIYVSSATASMNEDELWKLLETSRTNNTKMDITGILLYAEGSIIQMLEGEKEKVEALYSQISEDAKHQGLIKLLAEFTTHRDFPDWSMGFKRISSSQTSEVEGFNRLIERRDLSAHDIQYLSGKVQMLINSFRKSAGIDR